MALLSDYISEIDKKKLEEYMRSLPTDSSSDISKIEQPQDLSVNLASSVIPKSMMPEQFKNVKIEEPTSSSPIERLPTAKSKEVVQPNKISESPSQPLQEVVTPQPKFDVRDQELEQAQAESAERASWNRILGGIERAHDISTLSDLKYYSPEQAKQRDIYAQEPVERVKTKRAALLDRIKTEQEKTELDVSQQMTDPNSEISKVYLEGAAKLGFDIPKGTSAATLGKVFPQLINALNTQESIRARIQQAKDNLEERKLRREELMYQRELERQGKEDAKTERQQLQFSKLLKDSGAPEAITKLEQIDSILKDISGGKGIDEFNQDIPGYGRISGILPDALVSGKGSNLRQLVSSLANITLKDRSGAAVTEPEFERFKSEFGTGTWKSDKQLIEGLQKYKKALMSTVANIEYGTPSRAKEFYQKEGGSLPTVLLKKITKESTPINKYAPGDVINYQGKKYRVDEDGDNLIEIK